MTASTLQTQDSKLAHSTTSVKGKEYSDLQLNVGWGRKAPITDVFADKGHDAAAVVDVIRDGEYTDMLATSEASHRESNFSFRKNEATPAQVDVQDNYHIVVIDLGRKGMLYTMIIDLRTGRAVVDNCKPRNEGDKLVSTIPSSLQS